MHEEMSTAPEQSLGSRLHERIVHWDTFFRNATIEECAKATNAATNELDNLLNQNNVFHKECIVNGIGIWTEIVDIESESDYDSNTLSSSSRPDQEIVVREGHIRGKEGYNLGFYVQNMQPDEHPSLWCSFRMQTAVYKPHPTLTTFNTMEMYVKADSMAIVSRDSINETFVGDDCDAAESSHRLSIYSDQLIKLVSSTKFRRTKRERQLKQIDAIIDAAESATDVRDKDIMFGGNYAYASELREGTLRYRFVPIRNFIISGVCLGVTMAGKEMLDVRAIRRDKDLLSKYDGLAINVDVESVSGDCEHPDLKPGTVIKVPISGQELDALFETS